MKALSEILDNNLDDEGFPDLRKVLEIAAEEMGPPPAIDPVTHILLTKRYVDWALKYVGGIVLSIAADIGALPKGLEVEYENLELALEFHQFSQLYDLKWAQTQKHIEVPGQTSIPIPGE